MQGSPTRRSRRRPPKNGGPALPLVPILIGVIVLGFVIGAGLSMAGRHGSVDGSDVPVPSTAPMIPSPPPLADTPTPHPHASPTDEPSPSSSPSASPSPSPRPSPRATPSPHATASPTATTSPSTTASPAATGTSAPTDVPASATPAPTTKPTHAPPPPPTLLPATPAPPATAAPPVASPVSQGASSPFGRLAASVVRVYLTSVAHGDRASAAAERESPPAGNLPEEGVVDASTEVRSVQVHGTGDLVTVDVDVRTSAGAYAGRYTVRKSATGAAVIVDGSLVKI